MVYYTKPVNSQEVAIKSGDFRDPMLKQVEGIRREMKTNSPKTVDDVARSDFIKMISWANLVNFVCTKTL